MINDTMSLILERTQNDFPDLPPEWIEKVVNQGQWKAAKDALDLHKSIEVTGLGKFTLRKRSAKYHLKQLEGIYSFYEKDIEHHALLMGAKKLETKMEILKYQIDYIKTKL